MIYGIGPYQLDAEARELRRDGTPVSMEPQVFDLLLLLVRNRERVLSKDDLLTDVWEGRLVSDSTISSRIAAVRRALGDDGQCQRFVRTVPRKGYQFVGPAKEQDGGERMNVADDEAPTSRLRDLIGPTLAVLPFANLSPERDQAYVAAGITEDITTALARFSGINVVAPPSHEGHPDSMADVRKHGRELGVRYLVCGSVRISCRRLRIATQLVDADSGTHLWADRFDGDLSEILDLQDHLTSKVIGAITPTLERVEIERARQKRFVDLNAYDLYLRGIAHAYEWTRSGMDNALAHFTRALQTDKNFAPAYGMAAYCFVQRKSYAWTTDHASDTQKCATLTKQGAVVGRHDAVTLARVAHGEFYVVRDIDQGTVLVDRALELNPNLTTAWYVKGWISVCQGDHEQAIDCARRARRLTSLFNPTAFKLHTLIAYAQFFEGRFDDAVTEAVTALRLNPNYLTALRGAAASLALCGRLEEATRFMTELRSLDDDLRLSNLEGLFPLRRAEDFQRWSTALQLAGLPG